jgi:hypothetical protein
MSLDTLTAEQRATPLTGGPFTKVELFAAIQALQLVQTPWPCDKPDWSKWLLTTRDSLTLSTRTSFETLGHLNDLGGCGRQICARLAGQLSSGGGPVVFKQPPAVSGHSGGPPQTPRRDPAVSTTRPSPGSSVSPMIQAAPVVMVDVARQAAARGRLPPVVEAHLILASRLQSNNFSGISTGATAPPRDLLGTSRWISREYFNECFLGAFALQPVDFSEKAMKASYDHLKDKSWIKGERTPTTTTCREP